MFLSELQSSGRHPLTVYQYGRMVDEVCRIKEEIRQISRADLTHYADTILVRKQLLPEQRTAWLIRMKKFFAWAVTTDLILSDPAAKIKLPKKKSTKLPTFLTRSQMGRLLDGIEDPRDRAICELLYSTGIRSGELRKLTQRSIDRQQQTITILLGKNQKDRIVPVGKVALHWLDRYLQNGGKFHPEALLFPKMDEHVLCGMISKYAKAAGIRKHITPHAFRHSFAIHMIQAGAGIAHIGAMLGHAHLSTTQHYTQISAKDLVAAHKRSHPCRRREASFFF